MPFIAEGFANAFYIDQSLDFLSFVGALFAVVGVFKIHKGDRRRRAIIIREQLILEEEEFKRQEEERVAIELAEREKKSKNLGTIDENDELEYIKDKKAKHAAVDHDFMVGTFDAPTDRK